MFTRLGNRRTLSGQDALSNVSCKTNRYNKLTQTHKFQNKKLQGMKAQKSRGDEAILNQT